MKHRKKLLQHFVSLVAAFFIGIAIIVACSDEPDPYDYYTSFFHSDLQGQKDFGAFYFTDYQFTYGEEEPVSEAAVNAAEWAGYLGAPVKAADVEKMMYHLDSAGKEQANRFLEQGAPVADSLANNQFLAALKQPAHWAAKKYYQFAVQTESLSQANYNYWEPAPLDTAGLKTAAAAALQAALAEKDRFIKLRYFYQAQRLNHYAENYEQASQIYDRYIIKTASNSHTKGWALALKAGEQRRLGDTAQAAYLFSKVFAQYPERRLQAYRNYHYIGVNFGDVLKLARTPAEKANLYAIRSFADREINIDELKQVYDNDPASVLTGVLLVREINKLEQYYLTPKLANNTDAVYSKKTGIKTASVRLQPKPAKWLLITSIIILITGLILLIIRYIKPTFKTGKPLAAGILTAVGAAGVTWFGLSYYQQKPDAAQRPKGDFFVAIRDSVKTKYDKDIENLRSFCTQLSNDGKYAEPQIGVLADAYLYFIQNKPDEGLTVLETLNSKPLSEKLNNQKQIINLLLAAQQLKEVQPVDESKLLPSLQWLTGKVVASRKPKNNLYPETPGNHNQFAITERNLLYELLGTIELREHRYAEAVTVFQQIKNQKLKNADYNGQDYYNDGQTLQGDPFYVEINDYPKAFVGKRYTKLTFAQKMAQLQISLKANPQDAGIYVEMANGFYNTSAYGNSWGLIVYSWSAYDFGREPIYYFDTDYTQTLLAESYYLKAKELSRDNELKAKCTFMAAKCEQKQHQTPNFDNYADYNGYEKQKKQYLASIKQNRYFGQMQQYKTTAFYKKAVAECSYLSDFIKSD
ncbi:MAG: hypothetical protein EOP42_02480 [Sphingobacteriaceae bacterium]|nr:MAG: hypothetical protein EOP42_02480 [Sphingobacteriaceae bacterium]